MKVALVISLRLILVEKRIHFYQKLKPSSQMFKSEQYSHGPAFLFMSACPGVYEKSGSDVTLVIVESPSAMALLIEMNSCNFLG